MIYVESHILGYQAIDVFTLVLPTDNQQLSQTIHILNSDNSHHHNNTDYYNDATKP